MIKIFWVPRNKWRFRHILLQSAVVENDKLTNKGELQTKEKW